MTEKKHKNSLSLVHSIKEELKNFKGKLIQKYPIYSSKTVSGKQLFQYAREGEEVEIPKREINIKKINLSINIGTENASLTALLVAIISSITGIVFRKSIIDSKKQSFRIVPVYINKNLINIAVSGIFEIKMIHIINIMYVLNKKEGVKKNERTSNRRTYDYSYE